MTICPVSREVSTKQFDQNLGYNPPLGIKFRDRIIKRIHDFDAKIEAVLPNFLFQNKIDALSQEIKKIFQPLKAYNNWLQSNGHGSWYTQLATFLIKLPLRVQRDIIHLLYKIVSELLYAAVHPIKAMNQAATYLVTLVFELTRPEVWSKIGSGLVGVSSAQLLFQQLATPGNPISTIPLAIGGALVIAGMTVGPTCAAIRAPNGLKWEAFKRNIWIQMKELPDSIVTGFCMGLLFSCVEMGLNRFLLEIKARQFAQKLIKDSNKSEYFDHVTVDSSGKIHLYLDMKKKFRPSEGFFEIEYIFSPKKPIRTVTHQSIGDKGSLLCSHTYNSLQDVGFTGSKLYPSIPTVSFKEAAYGLTTLMNRPQTRRSS